MLKNKTILIGITGGIAAYKICSLIRMYKNAGADVKVVVTPNALQFVTKLTLQTLSNNPVYVDNFETDNYKPEHISLTEADIFVIAPASANTIGKIANGICDNLLLSTVCAFNKPVVIAPAMNENMWNNKFVQDNIEKLQRNGYYIINPSSGFLACGTEGTGRMQEAEAIFDKTIDILNCSSELSGKNILITAGGTREKIDPVRYITNASSGKMGIALAKAAAQMGANVTLISTFKINGNFRNIVTETAGEMQEAVMERLPEQDCVIMAAAVSDYRVANYSENKIKKSDDTLTLELTKNPDILKTISENRMKSNQLIVGFCAESENLSENAEKKITDKGCDFLIANDISRKDIGFNSDENEVYIIDRELNSTKLEKASKDEISRKILKFLSVYINEKEPARV